MGVETDSLIRKFVIKKKIELFLIFFLDGGKLTGVGGEEVGETVVNGFLLGHGSLAVDVDEFVEFGIDEEGEERGHGIGRTHGGELFEGRGDLRASLIDGLCHLVEALAMVGVPHFAESLLVGVEQGGDEGVAVGLRVEGLPAVAVGRLHLADNALALAQILLATHAAERVEVETEDEVGVVGDGGDELVVEVELVVGEILAFLIGQGDDIVAPVDEDGLIGGVIDGSARLDGDGNLIDIGLHDLVDGEGEGAGDLFDIGELCARPLLAVDELFEALLECLEARTQRSIDLLRIDGHRGVEFLGIASP